MGLKYKFLPTAELKQKEYDALAKVKSDLEKELQQEKEKSRRLTSQLDSQKLQASQFQEENTKLTELNEKIKSDFKESDQKLKDTNKTLSDLNSQLKEAYETPQQELKTTKDHNLHLQGQLNTSDELIKALGEQLQASEDKSGQIAQKEQKLQLNIKNLE